MHFRDYMYKCVYEDNKWATKSRLCSEVKDIVEYKLEEICEVLEVTDPSKECIAYKDKCIESYRECEDYNENVEKEKCEAIIPEEYDEKKCVFRNNKCVSENRSCSSFKLENIKKYCLLLGSPYNIKCTYSNGLCLEEKKESAINENTYTIFKNDDTNNFNLSEDIYSFPENEYNNTSNINKDTYIFEFENSTSYLNEDTYISYTSDKEEINIISTINEDTHVSSKKEDGSFSDFFVISIISFWSWMTLLPNLSVI